MAHAIYGDYLAARPHWMDLYSRPNELVTLQAVEYFARTVERNDLHEYEQYVDAVTRERVQNGVPPVMLLFAAELLYDCLLRHLTIDQIALVQPLIEAEHQRRTSLLHEVLFDSREVKGA